MSDVGDLEEPRPSLPAAKARPPAPRLARSLPVEGQQAREQSGHFMLAGALACLVLLPGAWLCVRCAVPGPGRRSSFIDAYVRAADSYTLVRQDLPQGRAEDGRGMPDEEFWRWSRAAAGLPDPKSGVRDRPWEAKEPGGSSRALTRHVNRCRGDAVDGIEFDDMARNMETHRPSMPVPRAPLPVGRLAELWSLFGGEENGGTPGGDAEAIALWRVGN